MTRQLMLASAAAFALAMLAASPSSALTMKECSVKYQEARKNNTLKGQKWNEFRKAQCSDDDASENDAAAAVTDTAPTPATGTGGSSSGRARAAVFPRAVAEKYSSETPGKARLKTCADQYNANKERNANGDLKWIQKGGGYWSQCNARLKG